MSRILALPSVLCLICALALLSGAVMVAARAGDGILLVGTLCAVGGVLLLSSWRPRGQTSGGYRRGRVRVRKAFALEMMPHDAGRPQRPTRGRAHPAA